MALRILIVDDHFIARKGLIASLASEPDINVVAEASNGAQALEAYAAHHPDLVLMDLRLPIHDGIETTQLLRQQHPAARIAMLTVSQTAEDLLASADAGAVAYMAKTIERDELLRTLRSLADGGTAFTPEQRSLLQSTPRLHLTKREKAVLEGVGKGQSNKEIAHDLAIAEPTVRLHLSHLFRKLNVLDRTQALIQAVRRGVIRVE
jgi:DNA-binding NarL/FixJ family response regulator